MKSLHFISFLLTLGFSPSFSQQAIDFSMKDTGGKEWNLYTELQSGRTVVLDFFFADCIPCQTFTPQMASIYTDYGGDSGEVLVLGISDRDDNQKLQQFNLNYGVNYPSAGTEGGGDSITSLYMSWFTFIGWPTYAVICPDKEIHWDIEKKNGLPELKMLIDSCQSITGIPLMHPESETIFLHPTPSTGILYVNLNRLISGQYRIFNSLGTEVSKGYLNGNDRQYEISILDLSPGVYFMLFQTGDNVEMRKFIKTNSR